MSLRHIAFIMDGNRRWAKKGAMSLKEGYEGGLRAMERIIPILIAKGISCGTFFAFSSENWKRSVAEIAILQDTIESALLDFREFTNKHEVRIKVIGDVGQFRKGVQDAAKRLEEETRHHDAFYAQVAAGYGGMQDIVQAAKQCASNQDGKTLTKDVFESYLQAQTLGPVDMLVRTGGQRRLSNFLLWQCAYAELFFIDTFWPDFSRKELQEALDYYGRVKRNYGV